MPERSSISGHSGFVMTMGKLSRWFLGIRKTSFSSRNKNAAPVNPSPRSSAPLTSSFSLHSGPSGQNKEDVNSQAFSLSTAHASVSLLGSDSIAVAAARVEEPLAETSDTTDHEQLPIDHVLDDETLRKNVRNAFRQQHTMEEITSAHDALAVRYLNIIQEMLDKDPSAAREDKVLYSEPEDFHARRDSLNRHSLRKLLVKLSQLTDTLPDTLFLDGIQCTNKETIGGGAFSDIFLATYEGGDVALKRLRTFQNSPVTRRLLRDFCREVLVWRQLCHANIHVFFGVDRVTFSQQLCLVSPWMKNGNIHHCMKHWAADAGPIPSARWLLEIAQGLAYLHKEHIVHGDLRGPNVLIDDDLHARLTDFGLTIISDATSYSSYSGGAARWMAPELLDPEQFGHLSPRATYASDVYSFACVAIEIFTRTLPFAEYKYDRRVILPILTGVRPMRPAEDSGNQIPDAIWRQLEFCWDEFAINRPHAADIVARLDPQTHQSSHNIRVTLPNTATLVSQLRLATYSTQAETLFAMHDTYLTRVQWVLIDVFHVPGLDVSLDGHDRHVEYKTGIDIIRANVAKNPRTDIGIPLRDIALEVAATINNTNALCFAPANITLNATDVEKLSHNDTISWDAEARFVYQRRCSFRTDVWLSLSTCNTECVIVDGEQVLTKSCIWEVSCKELAFTAKPLLGQEKMHVSGIDHLYFSQKLPHYTYESMSNECKHVITNTYGMRN